MVKRKRYFARSIRPDLHGHWLDPTAAARSVGRGGQTVAGISGATIALPHRNDLFPARNRSATTRTAKPDVLDAIGSLLAAEKKVAGYLRMGHHDSPDRAFFREGFGCCERSRSRRRYRAGSPPVRIPDRLFHRGGRLAGAGRGSL